MVSRPATDRQILDLQNAESATAWIMSFVAKFCAKKKEDNINTYGTIQDLQATNFFLSMCRKNAIIELRSLISPRNLIETSYKDFRLVIQNYFSLRERVIKAERAKFLSVIQGVRESEARYWDFEKLNTPANPDEELLKIKFISCLRDLEANLRLPDGFKAKAAISDIEMTKNLQFISQAMAFASS